jgi:hypothetical protein
MLSTILIALLVGEDDGVDSRPEVSTLDAEGENAELGFEADAEAPLQRLEMMERICLAAGQTS